MPPRRKLAELSGLKWATGSAVEALLNRLDAQGMLVEGFGGKSRRTSRRAVHADLKFETEYGTAIQDLRFETTDGNFIDLPCIDPFAYLNWLAHFSEAFSDLLASMCHRFPPSPASPWNVVWYLDEFSPGNLLATDNSRKAWIFYWSFLEVPPLLRQREIGWFYAGVIRTKHANMIKGGLSGVFKTMMHRWFGGPTVNMPSTGFSVHVNGSSHLLFGKMRALIGDEAALKAIWKNKGASGIKPCILCCNLVSSRSGLAPLVSDVLVDLNCTDLTLLVPHSDATIWESIDKLGRSCAPSKAKLEHLETILGFSSDPAGVLHDRMLRRFLHPATSTYYDWCHVFVAGGICQWEMWDFMAVLSSLGVKWTDIEEYHQSFCWPSHVANVPKNVWNRAREASAKSAKVIKMGASEMLSSYSIFRKFVGDVLEGVNAFLPERRSLQALFCVLDGLASHPKPCDADALHSSIVEYLNVRQIAYPDSAKPKHHFALHIAPALRDLSELLGCWVHERKHKTAKKFGTTSAHLKRWEDSVLTDLLNGQLEDLSKESDLHAGVYLRGTVDCTEQLSSSFPLERSINMSRAASCKGVRTERGDMVFVLQAGVVSVARVRCFLHTLPSNEFFCIVDQFSLVAGQSDVYESTGCGAKLVPLNCMVAAGIWSDTLDPSGVLVLDPPVVAWGVKCGRFTKA